MAEESFPTITELIEMAGSGVELAKVLGVTKRSVYGWKHDNKIPRCAMGRVALALPQLIKLKELRESLRQ